jgi:ESCRT-II complex subunit VPS22
VFIRSIPRELDTDQSLLLVLAKDAGGLLREADVRAKTGWSDLRTRNAMEDCVMREGVGWVDELPQGGWEVWIMAAVEFGEATG